MMNQSSGIRYFALPNMIFDFKAGKIRKKKYFKISRKIEKNTLEEFFHHKI